MTRTRAKGERTRDLSPPPAPEPLAVPVVDTHCHLDIDEEDGRGTPVDDAIRAAAEVGIDRIVQVGTDLPSARWSVQVVADRPALLATVALHPNEAPRLHASGDLEAAYAEIAELAAHPRVRGIGETGMDFFRTAEDGRAVQEESFRRHIRLAKELGKALTIHDRDAHDDVLRILEDEGAPDTVVFHCFSGDAAMATYCTGRGYYLSYAGVVTFANAAPLREALAVTPPAQVLVETDAPFLTPTPYRGRPNASYLVPLTVRRMAEVMDLPVDDLCHHLSANAERVFGPW